MLDGRLELKRVLERIGSEWDECIQIIYFSDEWRGIVDTVVNIWVLHKVGNFLKSWATMNSEERDLLHEFI
jgi:hypothetical protein